MNQGVARFADLRHDLSRARIDQLVAAGRLIRLRRGWYALPGVAPAVARAVSLGGTLSCVSALRHHDVWVQPDGVLHLRLSEHHRAGHRLPDGVRACRPLERAAPAVGVDPLDVALRTAVSCLDEERLVAAFDSILNQHLMEPEELAGALTGCPIAVRRLLAEADPAAQSGLESLVRFRLRRAGVKVRSQVRVDGVGLVDLLVGDRLVIETDGRQFHTGEATYAADRRRDLVLVTGGHLVLRLTYQQVVHGWDDVFPMILRLVRTRAHQLPRRGRTNRWIQPTRVE